MRVLLSLISLAAVLTLAVLVACSGGGGGGGNRSGNMASVNLTVSDPSTCTAPNGPFSNVYVTIADVKIHQSATAGDNDAGWVDLTPNLTPTQIDLLGTANTTCFLASLGTNIQLTAGKYQQMRIILLDNSKGSQVANNKCNANAVNCVVLASNGSKQTLNLSSESQTGIKVNASQMNGGFTVNAGDSRDLDIDFDTCVSIVQQGNGQYRLKPVLRAGEVSTNSSSISGKVVDSVSQAAISGGKVVVALEQKDANGIDRIIMSTVPDGSGNFVFCPVMAGTYDVVAIAINGSGTAYAPTITTGVQPGNTLGTIPLIAQTGTSTAPASITGTVTAATAANAGASADISLSALEAVGANNLLVTIPQASTSATMSLATAAGGSCPANTNCATYTVQVPATMPNVGAFTAGTTTYTQATGAASYTMDALAFVPNSGGTADCTPSEQKSAAPIPVTAGMTANAPTLVFTGCQ